MRTHFDELVNIFINNKSLQANRIVSINNKIDTHDMYAPAEGGVLVIIDNFRISYPYN